MSRDRNIPTDKPMEYWEARPTVFFMLDPHNGHDLNDYDRKALAAVLEWADRYEDLSG